MVCRVFGEEDEVSRQDFDHLVLCRVCSGDQAPLMRSVMRRRDKGDLKTMQIVVCLKFVVSSDRLLSLLPRLRSH